MRIDRRDPKWRGRGRLFGPALLLATAAVMLAWTWRAWPDPLVDFGRELYVPWRLSRGDVLFRDIAWFNGPLSQYWNATLFRVFGPGLIVLVWSNVLVLLACVWMLYGLIARLSDRFTATVAGMVFLLVFAFGQYVGIGNYNWIAPYSHELTHGTALGLAALVALERWRRSRATLSLALGGLALGLCFLTKPEPFVAGAAASLILLGPAAAKRDARALGVFLGAAAVPIGVSVLLAGLHGTLGAWPAVLAGNVARLPFYRADMGLDMPGFRLAEMLVWSGIWILGLAVAVAAAWLGRTARGPLLPLACAAASGLVMFLFGGAWWASALRPLPLAVVVIAVVLLVTRRGDGEETRVAAGLAFAAFSLALLLKMILRARVAHYGFALAMPATLLVVTALVGWLPARLSARGFRGDVVRACVLLFLASFAIEHVWVTRGWLARKTETVGVGRDRFRSDVRGAFVQRAVSWLDSAGTTSAAALPEGVLINYLARVPNPTPFVNFMPPEEILFGDSHWTEAFRHAPPQVILLVPKNTSEYGRGSFGGGYARTLASWVAGHYALERVIRVKGVPFDIRILRRRGARSDSLPATPPAHPPRRDSLAATD